MLVQLNITDFAIIRRLNLSLGEGLNILSGETGAGKSIIISAINLILGGRSSADLIRSKCREAVVEGLFVFPDNSVLDEALGETGIPFDGELVIKRIISREGRNKVFINGSLSTLQILARLGPKLISISGQYEHQRLLNPENHLYLLDDFSGLEEDRVALGRLFDRYQGLKGEIRTLQKDIIRQEERQDLSLFQIQEIETAGAVPGEDGALADEKRRLQHAEELLEIAADGYQTLYERNDSALTSVARCAKALDKGARMEKGLGPIRDSLSEITVLIEDAAFALRDFQKGIQIDPQRLEQVVERLELLKRLKRKYGETIEDVLRFKDKMASRVFDLNEKKEKERELTTKLHEMQEELVQQAIGLSQKRRKRAEVFRIAVERELHQLDMKATEFQVRFEDLFHAGQDLTGARVEDMRPEGLDRIEFMISPNPGETLRPLSRIASGGELSRIMLAIKTILSRTTSVETVIFDEVDAGVSGATAQVVGEKISSLASFHQIVCITHLPQIACQGETHFLVRKEVVDGRTEAAISELNTEARVQEIARLLGGREITLQAVAHAEDMLRRK